MSMNDPHPRHSIAGSDCLYDTGDRSREFSISRSCSGVELTAAAPRRSRSTASRQRATVGDGCHGGGRHAGAPARRPGPQFPDSDHPHRAPRGRLSPRTAGFRHELPASATSCPPSGSWEASRGRPSLSTLSPLPDAAAERRSVSGHAADALSGDRARRTVPARGSRGKSPPSTRKMGGKRESAVLGIWPLPAMRARRCWGSEPTRKCARLGSAIMSTWTTMLVPSHRTGRLGGMKSLTGKFTSVRGWALLLALLLGAGLMISACGDEEVPTPTTPAPTPTPTPTPTPEPEPEPTGLATPENLRVSGTTSTSITWTWDAVEGALAYQGQFSTDSTFSRTSARPDPDPRPADVPHCRSTAGQHDRTLPGPVRHRYFRDHSGVQRLDRQCLGDDCRSAGSDGARRSHRNFSRHGPEDRQLDHPELERSGRRRPL